MSVKKHSVNIIFDGIVIIGPAEPPEDVAYLEGPLFAVMPRANRQISRYSKLYGDEPSYIPFHLPVMFTEMTPLVDCDFRRPDEIFVYPSPPEPDQKTFSIWYPMRERLVFRIDDEVDCGRLTYEVAPADRSALGQRGSVKTIADMREIWPERSLIRRELLSSGTPAANEVSAQVFIPRGHVNTVDHGGKAVAEPAYFKPKRTNKTLEKRLAPQTRVTVDVDERVQVFSYSMDTGEKLDCIVFDVKHDADIFVGNADPGDIRRFLEALARSPHQSFRSEPRRDLDFELYYPLLDGDDDGGGLPVPFSNGHFGDPNCYTGKVGGST
jgi:hypothetical protein